MTKNNIKKLLPIAAISLLVIGVIGMVPNVLADYHKGQIWDNSTHSNEFYNDKIPIAFDTSDLSSDLPLASGTSISQIYTELEDAIDEWDTETEFYVERYDTTSSYYDNVVRAEDLSQTVYARASSEYHYDWSWPPGYDGHILKVSIDFNGDENDWEWDHDGDSTTTDPAQIRIYNIMLHEMGHVNGLCDTYSPGAGTAFDCHGHEVSTSVMDRYQHNVIETITTDDKSEVNGQY